jgi:uncharacterized phosphosugar-binding protein
MVRTIREDKVIHVFGSGHSHLAAIELFARAGGLANVDAVLDPDIDPLAGVVRASKLERLPGLADIIWDSHRIEPGDILIIVSNSGRNALPIEMAMRAKTEGIPLAALTSLSHSQSVSSRHPSGKKLYELADAVLDTCIPAGDCLLEDTGPASTLADIFLLHQAVCLAVETCRKEGIEPMLFRSQNLDGSNNDAIYAKYQGRIAHF